MDVITLLLVAAINRLPGAAAQAARPLGRSRRVLEVATVVTKAPLGNSVVPVVTAEVTRRPKLVDTLADALTAAADAEALGETLTLPLTVADAVSLPLSEGDGDGEGEGVGEEGEGEDDREGKSEGDFD